MNDILAYKTWIILGIFLLLFTMEHLRPAAPSPKKVRPLLRIFKNLSFWPINIGLSLAIILPISFFATQHPLWNRPAWLPDFAIDILLLDLFIYTWHWSVHKIPFFWRFHEIHHLDEHLDTTSAVRFHGGEIVFATCARAIIIIVCAIPFSSILIFETLVLSAALFHHSNISLPPRIENALSKVIITPALHWVHHHAVRHDTDSNYGTIFSIWDKIFATNSKTKRTKSLKIGVEKKSDTTFTKLLLAPFQQNNLRVNTKKN